MNIETARMNMIEQQIRTWDVLDQGVLDLLEIVKREDFVPRSYKSLAFVDMEIPLPGGEYMFPPKLEARLVQDVAVNPGDRVLEIGTGSGYLTALLAHQAAQVVTVEIAPELRELAADNLARAGIVNVEIQLGDGSRGWEPAGLVDILVVCGSIPIVPDSLLNQLKIGGRLWAVVGDEPIMSAQLITRVTQGAWEPVSLFETSIKPLRNAAHPPRFEF
jgi:protein-L-isoaspartate(D-aspartate) O-methyltransferase